jgi:hypothetical protein
VGLLLAAPYSLLTMHACHFTSIKILLLLLLLTISLDYNFTLFQRFTNKE